MTSMEKDALRQENWLKMQTASRDELLWEYNFQYQRRPNMENIRKSQLLGFICIALIVGVAIGLMI